MNEKFQDLSKWELIENIDKLKDQLSFYEEKIEKTHSFLDKLNLFLYMIKGVETTENIQEIKDQISKAVNYLAYPSVQYRNHLEEIDQKLRREKAEMDIDYEEPREKTDAEECAYMFRI